MQFQVHCECLLYLQRSDVCRNKVAVSVSSVCAGVSTGLNIACDWVCLTLQPSGHYMYRTVVTICTAQWSLYVPHSGYLTLRLLMSYIYIYIYIYMELLFLMFLDHTQRRTTVGRTPLDE